MLNLENYDFTKGVIPKHLAECLSELTNKAQRLVGECTNPEILEFCKTYETTPKELVKMLRDGILDFSYCKVCGKKTNKLGATYCCCRCRNLDKDWQNKFSEISLQKYGTRWPSSSKQVRERVENTNLERYGTTSTLANEEIRKKAHQAMVDRYGVDNIFKSDEFKEYLKQYNLERYGVEYSAQAEEVKAKKIATFLEKYGVPVPAQNPEICAKMKQTFIDRYGEEAYRNQLKNAVKQKYGVDNISQTPEWKEWFREACLERFGTEHPLQNPYIKTKMANTKIEKYGEEWYRNCLNIRTAEIHGDTANHLPWVREKARQTNLEKYGAPTVISSPEFIDNRKRKHYAEVYDKFCDLIQLKGYKCLSTRDQFADYTQPIQILHECGAISATMKRNFYRICGCKCQAYESLPERELFEYIQSLLPDTEIIRHDRTILKGRELDIYIPSLKLAFEYNGNYWHCSFFHDKAYHTSKTVTAYSKGIRLIHVFDYNWHNNRNVVKSLIKNALGLLESRIDLKQCERRTIGQQEFEKFVQTNSLSIPKVVNPEGWYYNDQLVYVTCTDQQVCTFHCGLINTAFDNVQEALQCPLLISIAHEQYIPEGKLVEPKWVYVKGYHEIQENVTRTDEEELSLFKQGWLKIFLCSEQLV